MSPRKRPFIAKLRTFHRWTSMIFVVFAAILILPVIPAGAAFNIVSVVAIVLLVTLLMTGIWMAVHHYVVVGRARGRRSTMASVDA